MGGCFAGPVAERGEEVGTGSGWKTISKKIILIFDFSSLISVYLASSGPAITTPQPLHAACDTALRSDVNRGQRSVPCRFAFEFP